MTEQDERLGAELREYYRAAEDRPAPDVTRRVLASVDRRATRRRGWAAAGGGALVALAAAVVVLAIANHRASPTGVVPAHTPAPSSSASAVPTATPPPPSPPPPAAVAGPPVRGFVPSDVTSLSDAQWWVLGHDGASCAAPACTRIVRTEDGGHTFASIPVPPIAPGAAGQQALRLRFADPLDGWAVSSAGVVWATHDGGVTWAQDHPGGFVTDLAASAGRAVAIACSFNRINCILVGTTATADSWTMLPGSGTNGTVRNLLVNGSHVWAVDGGAGSTFMTSSADGGRTFVSTDVCPGALGISSVYAATSTVLWATCATGTQATVFRSTDGGVLFRRVGAPGIANSSSIGGVSAGVAVAGSGGSLLRSVDGGRTFAVVATGSAPISIVGFTTVTSGFALDASGRLWRSTDAGAHWAVVRFP